MSGTFDKEEWSFECKRDEAAAQELEAIQKIRDKWQSWINYRKTNFTLTFDDNTQEFANKKAEEEIAKLKKKWK